MATFEHDPTYDDHSSEEYPPDWEERRTDVLRRDNYTCRDCGVTSTRVDDVVVTVDHVVPKSDGGSHALENLQTLCIECHAEKHPDQDDLQRRAAEHRERNDRSLLRRLAGGLWTVLTLGRGGTPTVTDEYGRRLALTPVAAIPGLGPDEAVTTEATVLELWDPHHEDIQQLGLLADDDGEPPIKFVAWADDGLQQVSEGERYRFVGAATIEYEGNVELKLDALSSIRSLE